MVGSTIASIMASESIRMVFSAAPIGPCGSRIFIAEPKNGTGDNAAAPPTFYGRQSSWTAPPQTAGTTVRSRYRCSRYLKLGITGGAICGCGNGAILEAFPIPLGSTATLFIPPALAGPCGIPLIPTFPVPAEPAPRANCANEAAGGARTRKIAKAIFVEVFDMAKLHDSLRERRRREADLGCQSAGTIKMNFRVAFRGGYSQWSTDLLCR